MATGARAVERIAEAAGIPAVTVDTVSRVLKQHQPPLWSRSGQGGGKRAQHVQPEHLVNLGLALAWADPISNAPAIVARLRSMSFRSRTYDQPFLLPAGDTAYVSNDVPVNRLITAKGQLGRTLDTYVYGMATDPVFREMCREDAFCLQLSEWPAESATLSWTTEKGGLWREKYDGLGLLGTLAPVAPAAALRRTVTLPFALFEVLADLYADTLSRAQSALSLPVSESAPTTAGPETESADPLPQGSAHIRDQERDISAPVPEQHSEANGEREQSQAPSRGSGRSTARHRSRRNGRHDSADRACA